MPWALYDGCWYQYLLRPKLLITKKMNSVMKFRCLTSMRANSCPELKLIIPMKCSRSVTPGWPINPQVSDLPVLFGWLGVFAKIKKIITNLSIFLKLLTVVLSIGSRDQPTSPSFMPSCAMPEAFCSFHGTACNQKRTDLGFINTAISGDRGDWWQWPLITL